MLAGRALAVLATGALLAQQPAGAVIAAPSQTTLQLTLTRPGNE